MRFKIIIGLVALCFSFSAQAQSAPVSGLGEPLKVAVKPSPPFVIKTEAGEYEGISIELWQQIASELDLEFAYTEDTLSGVIDGVADGQYDVGVGAMTVTAEREQRLDFSQPFYDSGLAIAVRNNDRSGWWAVASRFFTLEFLSALAALAGILLLSGAAVWFFERRYNRGEFAEDAFPGLGDGFWWAAVTMTTVGYGDKSPRSRGGRIVGLVWMFASVIIISSFTASIASSLTVGELGDAVSGPDDLDSATVGTVTDSFSAEWLNGNNIGFRNFEDLTPALDALAEDGIEAVVYDAPLLQYLISNRTDGELKVLPARFVPYDYALLFAPDSALSEPVNRKLLQIIASPQWNDRVNGYLGKAD